MNKYVFYHYVGLRGTPSNLYPQSYVFELTPNNDIAQVIFVNIKNQIELDELVNKRKGKLLEEDYTVVKRGRLCNFLSIGDNVKVNEEAIWKYDVNCNGVKIESGTVVEVDNNRYRVRNEGSEVWFNEDELQKI